MEKITSVLASILRRINEKPDTLLDMSLSGDISRDEYVAKKRKLLAEKADIREKTRRISDGGAEWLEPALFIIKQAKSIPNALQSPDPADRANLFKTIGSNRTLRAKTVRFAPAGAWEVLYTAPCGRAPQKPHASDSECVSVFLSSLADDLLLELKKYFEGTSPAPHANTL